MPRRRLRGQDTFTAQGGCRESFLSLDYFKQPLHLVLPDGRKQYNTCLGSLLSIITFFTLITYSFYRLLQSINLDDYTVLEQHYENYYNGTNFFGYVDEFIVAAGLSDYSGGKNKNITDPTMGQLRFIMKSYGHSDIKGIQFKQLETRPCTDADFNYAADHDDVYTQFYPVESS